MKLTLEEIRKKEVINIIDGSSFGLADDVSFETETKEVTGIIVRNRPNFFGREDGVFIGWEEINTFGKDIILVKTEQKGKLHKREENIFQKLLNFFLY